MSSKSLALVILSLFSSLGWSQSCENLLSKSIPNASIKESHIVMAGEFGAPRDARSRGIYDELPEFCRVSLLLAPSPDSEINVEVWLPTESWNGKYRRRQWSVHWKCSPLSNGDAPR